MNKTPSSSIVLQPPPRQAKPRKVLIYQLTILKLRMSHSWKVNIINGNDAYSFINRQHYNFFLHQNNPAKWKGLPELFVGPKPTQTLIVLASRRSLSMQKMTIFRVTQRPLWHRTAGPGGTGPYARSIPAQDILMAFKVFNFCFWLECARPCHFVLRNDRPAAGSIGISNVFIRYPVFRAYNST